MPCRSEHPGCPGDPEDPGQAPSSARRVLPWLLGSALLLLGGGAGGAVTFLSWTAVPPGPSPSPTAAPEQPRDACAHLRQAPQSLFGQLVAENAELTEGTLRWHSQKGLAGVTLSPGLSYDPETQELVVAEAGVFYVFLRLELRRVVDRQGEPSSVSLALRLRPGAPGTSGLALTLELPPFSSSSNPPKDSATAFQGTLLRLEAGHRLAVQLSHLTGKHEDWQLAQGATVLGLFRVTPDGFPSELTLS